MTNSRDASTRTSLEVITRKLVDQAADEINTYLLKLPECGKTPAPDTAAAATRERIARLKELVDHFLGTH